MSQYVMLIILLGTVSEATLLFFPHSNIFSNYERKGKWRNSELDLRAIHVGDTRMNSL